MEEREKKLKREITDADVLSGIADTAGRAGEASVRKSKSGIMVKGIHDLAVRFSKCCNPVPGDEIVGFVTRGRGVSIHRTDLSLIHISAIVEAGLKVPDDVSLVGFDNWDMSGYSDMHLTTVERNMGEIAREGARVLLRRLDEGIVDNRRIYLNNKPVSYTHLDVYKRQAL